MAYPIYNAPTPEQAEIDRRRKMAEMLRSQSQSPLQGQMVSGHYVAPSWTQGIAQLFGAYSARKTEDQADAMDKNYSERGANSATNLGRILADPNTDDASRNEMLMRHSTQYGNRGIDAYLSMLDANTKAQNARTNAETAKMKRDKMAAEAQQAADFVQQLFPGVKAIPQPGQEDYSVGIDETGSPVGGAAPVPISFDAGPARVFGMDDEAVARIQAAAAKNPKLAQSMAMEEYKRLTRAKADARDALAKEKAIAEAMGIPVSEYLKQKLNKQGQQITVNNMMPDKAAESAAKKEGYDLGEQFAMIENKYSALDSVREAKQMLEKGIYAGTYGDIKKMLAKGTFGAVGDRQKAINTEEFVSYIGNVVVPRLKEFGGNDSNEELRYLKSIMGGDTSMEPEAIARIIDSAERKIQRGIERLQRQRGALEGGKMPALDPGPSRTGQPAAARKPAVQPAATAPGVRKYNPATGRIE